MNWVVYKKNQTTVVVTWFFFIQYQHIKRKHEQKKLIDCLIIYECFLLISIVIVFFYTYIHIIFYLLVRYTLVYTNNQNRWRTKLNLHHYYVFFLWLMHYNEKKNQITYRLKFYLNESKHCSLFFINFLSKILLHTFFCKVLSFFSCLSNTKGSQKCNVSYCLVFLLSSWPDNH